MGVIMSAVVISREYITNLPYSGSDALKPVPGKAFFKALGDSYNHSQVGAVVSYLLSQSDTLYCGMRDFKERMRSAKDHNCPLSAADQLYIASIVQNVVYGRMKI